MKLFKNTDEKQKWLLASTLLNFVFSVAKLWVGWKLGSAVVTADGFHSISDVFGSLLILIALRIASRSFHLFPIGLNKLEDLAATIGGIAIFITGYEIARPVFLGQHIQIPSSPWIIIAFALSILLIESIFYLAEKKAAKRLNSPGVATDAVNWLGDMGAGAVVILGLLGAIFAIPYAQEVAIIVIIGFIFYGGFQVLKSSLLSLLDASADSAIVLKAKETIAHSPEIASVDNLVILRSGSIYIGDISVQVKENNAKKSHQVIDRLESDLKVSIPGLEIVTIHYAPEKHAAFTRALLLEDDKQTIAGQLGKVVWIKLISYDGSGASLNEEFIPFTPNDSGKTRPVQLIAWLIRRNADEVIFNGLHDDFMMLLDALGMVVRNDTLATKF
jgi:cation diffusion facilitator family transporter